MSTMGVALTDSTTMLRRNLLHAKRYPSMVIGTIIMPSGLLLLFVFAFGDTMANGITGPASGTTYVDYVSTGVFLLAMASAAMVTSINIAVDMTKGIVNRFRTMDIARGSILTGHVFGSVIQAMASVAVLIAVALVAGFRPTAGVVGWMLAVGLLVLVAFALTWIAICLGLLAKSVDTASNTPMLLQLFPFLSSAFVPADSMAPGLREFSQYQPFTPINEALRALLFDSPVGSNGPIAVAWCVAIALAGYLWARSLFRRDPQNT